MTLYQMDAKEHMAFVVHTLKTAKSTELPAQLSASPSLVLLKQSNANLHSKFLSTYINVCCSQIMENLWRINIDARAFIEMQ